MQRRVERSAQRGSYAQAHVIAAWSAYLPVGRRHDAAELMGVEPMLHQRLRRFGYQLLASVLACQPKEELNFGSSVSWIVHEA